MLTEQELKTSCFLSLVLRHKPQAAGISLDAHGWAEVDALIEGVNRTHPLDRPLLERIVATDDKRRYSFDADHTHIRANQGHSVPVDVEPEETEPLAVLYHGTGEKYCDSIERIGLIPKTRLHVHLSADLQTAIKVGARHGTPVIYEVDSARMYADGFRFYLSANGVWLTDRVPLIYLKRMENEE